MQPLPSPTIDENSRPFWDGVGQGVLRYQNCWSCGARWLPPRSECPACLAPEPGWEAASGRARLVSWVVYHRAFNPAFEERVPYTVAIVELEEGPRLISNIVGVSDPETLAIDQELSLRIEQDGDVKVPRFAPVRGA